MRRNNYVYQALPQTPQSVSTNQQQPPIQPPNDPDVLENENERNAENLRQKISALRSLTIDIGNEVRYQDKLLRGIDDDMDRTSGFLGNTMSRVIRLGKNGGMRHMFYMFLFVLFIFILLYFVIKMR